MAKPAGWLTQSDASGTLSLFEILKTHLAKGGKETGSVFLGLVHRLDRNVSGLVIFAKSPKAAAGLSRQFSTHQVRKFYRCRVEGRPRLSEARLVHFLRKEKSLKATVFPREAPGAKRAELAYRVLSSSPESSLLEVELLSGRFHQIRAQLAFIGHPVLGDTKYRARSPLPDHALALHAHRLVLRHPLTGRELELEAPPPPDLSEPLD